MKLPDAKNRTLKGYAAMYREFYSLTCAPFAITSHPEFIFLSAQHQTAIKAVIDGIDQQQGIIALIGEAGLGKTTLLLNALDQHQELLKTVYINQTTTAIIDHSSPKGIIRSISQEFGQEIQEGSFSEMVQDLQDTFIQSNQDGKNIVIVIDDAHYLGFETLQVLPQIINIFPYKQKFAQLILIGHPPLQQRLDNPKLKELQKHIGVISTLSRLKKKESRTYIRHTLRRATSQKKAILSGRALNTIVQAAQGIPRSLNMLCTDVLASGFQNHQNPISGRIARQVVVDFAARPTVYSARLQWLIAAGVMVVVGLLILFTLGKGPAIPTDPKTMIAMAQPYLQTLTRLDIFTPSPVNQPIEMQPGAAESLPPSPLVVAPVARPEKLSPTQVDQAPSKWVAASPLTSTLPTAPSTLPPVDPAPKRVIQRVTALMQQAFPTGGNFPLKVWANKGSEGVYREKEKLLVHVLAESDAYLQVDYYQADGQVVHLLPNLLDSNRVTSGQIFTLGNPGNTFQFEVTAPFGVEMLTVVARQEPFPTRTGTPNVESAADYLEKLAHHLQLYKTQGKAAAAFLHIRTAKGFPTRLSRTELP